MLVDCHDLRPMDISLIIFSILIHVEGHFIENLNLTLCTVEASVETASDEHNDK